MKEVKIMIHDIQALHEGYRSCVEDIIVSVATWWGMDHQYMYTEAWDFYYTRWTPLSKDALGSRLHEGIDKTWHNLSAFHGLILHINSHLHSPYEAFELIKKETGAKRPVMIYINDYWCHWRTSYQKEHQIQPCLVIGVEADNSGLMCIDPYTTREIKNLPIHDFHDAYKNIVTFEKREEHILPFSIQAVMIPILEDLLGLREEDNRFDRMRDFAIDIENTLDLNLEVDHNAPYDIKSDLFNTIKYIARRRTQFATLLTYISNRFHVDMLHYAQTVNQTAQKWDLIVNLLLRMYYSKDWLTSRKNIAKKVKEAADYEENIAESLLFSLISTK